MPTVPNWVSDIDRLDCVFSWLLFAVCWPNKILGLVYGLEGLFALICQWTGIWIDEQSLEAS